MKKILTICFLAIVSQLLSQNNSIDSLQKLVRTSGSERINVLNDLAVAYWKVDLSKSLVFAQEALELEEQLKYYKTKARTLNIIGVTHFNLGNYSLANDYYDKCLETARNFENTDDINKCINNKLVLYVNGYIKDSTKTQYTTFKRHINMIIERNNHFEFYQVLMNFIFIYHIPQTKDTMLFEYTEQLLLNNENNEILSAIIACEGYLYKINYDYLKALKKYEQALMQTKDKTMKVFFLENIGNIYFEMSRYKQSIKYFNDAISLLKSMNDDTSKETIYFIEASLGSSYLQLGNSKLALLVLQDALNYTSFFDYDKAVIYNNIGLSYLSLDSLEKAEKFIRKAIYLIDNLNNNELKLGSLHSLATLYIRNNQLINHQDLINEISDLIVKVSDSYITIDSYSLLSNYYEEKGNFKKAFGYLKKWSIINDSILSKKNRDELDEFQGKYDTEKKDQQIKLQEVTLKNKSLTLQYSLAGGSLALAALVLIIILYRKKNQAYKHLVYQNLNIYGGIQQKVCEGDLMEDSENGILDTEKYDNSTLDEEHKHLIAECLLKLIEDKVYIESGLTINNLAEKCGTNRTYLSIVINEKFNANFNSFINKLRIEEAKRILSANSNGSIPLKELYQMLGFSSYSTFHEAFKKCIGVTPAFYQNTVKELQGISN